MKKFIAALFSLAALSFAANVQILEPQGADFSEDAPTVVKSLLRAAVSKSGNTPVEDSAEIQLRASIMSMGGHLVVVCEQLKDGAVVVSNKQKAVSVESLDDAIEKAAVEALLGHNHDDNLIDQAPADSTAEAKKEPIPLNTSVITVEYEETPAPLPEKRPTRNYNGFGLGISLWHNYDYSADTTNKDDKDVDRDWSTAFMLHYARIYEVSANAAITMQDNANLVIGKGWEIHNVFVIGGRYYIQSGAVSPFFGGGMGVGVQYDNHYAEFSEYFALGFAANVEAGVVFFRNSAIQLELGATWDALWDGFDSFSRRFGAGNLYIAINY
ncbi:MAG: hypothetical protein IKZ45_07745 [Fibrobacter sp.]|nr:hypothetical protein [Fibrobacter sp.]